MIYSCTIHGINYLAIDGQVCFHRQLFADPVKPCWCITGPVGPLGSTNQNWLCTKLLPMIVLIYPVVCVHSCRLLGTQHYCLCSSGKEGPPSACPPTPTSPLPPPYKHHPYYRGCKKTISKTSSEYCMAELAMKQ